MSKRIYSETSPDPDDDVASAVPLDPPEIVEARAAGERAFKHWRDTGECAGVGWTNRIVSPWIEKSPRLHSAFVDGWNGRRSA